MHLVAKLAGLFLTALPLLAGKHLPQSQRNVGRGVVFLNRFVPFRCFAPPRRPSAERTPAQPRRAGLCWLNLGMTPHYTVILSGLPSVILATKGAREPPCMERTGGKSIFLAFQPRMLTGKKKKTIRAGQWEDCVD